MVDFVRTIFDWKWLKTAVGNLMGKLVENWLKEVLNKWLTNFFFFFKWGGVGNLVLRVRTFSGLE